MRNTYGFQNIAEPLSITAQFRNISHTLTKAQLGQLYKLITPISSTVPSSSLLAKRGNYISALTSR